MYGESADGVGQPGEGRPLQPDQHREGAAHAQNTPGGLSAQVRILLYNINVITERTYIHLNNTLLCCGRQVCVPPAAVADRGDGNQQPPEGSERQTVSAAQDRLSARRPPRQGDNMTSDTTNH